jgi:hypothetical protein
MHMECVFRSICGSVAHVERRCGCFVKGSEEGDPPGMTLRQAAVAAVQAFERRMATIRAGEAARWN